MLKFGYITELKVSEGLVRVNFPDDGIVSNYLPVSVPASKEDKYSFPFAINEHVWCLMDEHCEFGVVGGAIYSQKDAPPSGASEQNILIDIGATKVQLKIDRQAGNLELKVNGSVTIEAGMNATVKAMTAKVEAQTTATVKGTSVTIDAPATSVMGSLAVSGPLTAASFSGAGGAPMTASTGIQSSGPISAPMVTAAGVNLGTHIHLLGNNPTTPPV